MVPFQVCGQSMHCNVLLSAHLAAKRFYTAAHPSAGIGKARPKSLACMCVRVARDFQAHELRQSQEHVAARLWQRKQPTPIQLDQAYHAYVPRRIIEIPCAV